MFYPHHEKISYHSEFFNIVAIDADRLFSQNYLINKKYPLRSMKLLDLLYLCSGMSEMRS